ncbi:hypothetical protein H072_10723 [Dactylellina haptotyla CBS 200.50]|uniref:Uncharacterized protein n=1 Tax=Dactylellina haptotyla (strain CBS 200.50) TaxID=1284197 RepID=S8BKK2_DACHA|nr:hypothetical protein H072_10723 [Dactylellina haptotyla CBS 200.50]
MVLPRALKDMRSELVQMHIKKASIMPTDSELEGYNTQLAKLKADYLAEGIYYMNYSRSHGHSDYLDPSNQFSLLLDIRNQSPDLMTLRTANTKAGILENFPPEKIMLGYDAYLRFESEDEEKGIEANLVYQLGAYEVNITIKKVSPGDPTNITCVGLESNMYTTDTLFDGAILVIHSST